MTATTAYAVFGSALRVFHDLNSTPILKDLEGGVAAVGDTSAVVFDSATWGGGSLASVIDAASELKASGSITTTGSPPGGSSYSTETGAFSVTRTNSTNLAEVRIASITVGQLYAVNVQNTGSAAFSVRTNSGVTTVAVVSAGETKTVYVQCVASNLSIVPDTNGTTAAGTLHYARLVPGYHMLQATSAYRPTVRQSATTGKLYLEVDGINHRMQTQTLDLSATDKANMFVAFRKLSDAATAVLIEHGQGGTNTDVLALYVPRGTGNPRTGFQFRPTIPTLSGTQGPNTAAPVTWVVSALGDKSQATLATETTLRTNGSVAGNVTEGATVTGNLGNWPVNYFARQGGGLHFTGHYYGDMIVAGAVPNAGQISWAEAYYNSLCAAY
jgi:hypothetical protein